MMPVIWFLGKCGLHASCGIGSQPKRDVYDLALEQARFPCYLRVGYQVKRCLWFGCRQSAASILFGIRVLGERVFMPPMSFFILSMLRSQSPMFWFSNKARPPCYPWLGFLGKTQSP
jgi:hypothetical protein